MYLAIFIQLNIIYSIQSTAQTDTKAACGCCTPGIPGIPGNHGTAGAAGPVGMAGLKGDMGLKGETGLNGDTGLKGDKGAQGTNGIGTPGKQGPIGIQGQVGIKGIQGAKGETGLTGETGMRGEKGKTGGKQATTTSQAKSAFSVAFKTPAGRLHVGPMKYETVITNIGSDYSKETGKFVCQHPGTYVFQFTSQRSSSGKMMTTVIMKNGEITISAYEGSASGNGNGGSASNMVIMSLVRGDQVWTQPYSSSENYYHSTHIALCSFSGFLLYEA